MPRLNVVEVNHRVWTAGLNGHGHENVTVPETGGTIKHTVKEFGYAELFKVKWDTGQETLHYISEFDVAGRTGKIMLIGASRTKAEYDEMIAAEAVKAKIFGARLTIILRNGDTIVGYECPTIDWTIFPKEKEGN